MEYIFVLQGIYRYKNKHLLQQKWTEKDETHNKFDAIVLSRIFIQIRTIWCHQAGGGKQMVVEPADFYKTIEIIQSFYTPMETLEHFIHSTLVYPERLCIFGNVIEILSLYF